MVKENLSEQVLTNETSASLFQVYCYTSLNHWNGHRNPFACELFHKVTKIRKRKNAFIGHGS